MILRQYFSEYDEFLSSTIQLIINNNPLDIRTVNFLKELTDKEVKYFLSTFKQIREKNEQIRTIERLIVTREGDCDDFTSFVVQWAKLKKYPYRIYLQKFSNDVNWRHVYPEVLIKKKFENFDIYNKYKTDYLGVTKIIFES